MIALDSSFLIALHNEDDVHHAAAVAVRERLLEGVWGPGLLLEYVLLEVLTVIQMRLSLSAAISAGETLLRAQELEFVPCSELFLETLTTFRQEATAPLSFVDAAVATAARRHPPGRIATFDSDFAALEGITVVS